MASTSASISASELTLRRLLWLRHGHDGLYGDDGEMQCTRCPLDFLRASAEEIDESFLRQGRAQLRMSGLAPFTAPMSCLTPGCIHMRGHVGLCVKAEEIKA